MQKNAKKKKARDAENDRLLGMRKKCEKMHLHPRPPPPVMAGGVRGMGVETLPHMHVLVCMWGKGTLVSVGVTKAFFFRS